MKEEWLESLSTLFHDNRLVDLIDEIENNERINKKENINILKFLHVSSGQGIILSCVTNLYANISKETIIFYDEPETHLHPNAIYQLISILHEILNKTNSYAIIATHSPIIIQQIPSKYVRILSQINNNIKIKQPLLETFGENLTALTNEIFGSNMHDEYYKKILEKIAFQKDINIDKLFEGDLSLNARIFYEGKKMKLNMIEYDAKELVERFIESKREPIKTKLSEIKNEISQADLQYRECGKNNTLKTIKPITLNTRQRDSLKRCYKDKTKETDLIINKIRNEQNEFHRDYCPFCSFHDPLEIDHYLPMAEFPEFSFIPINLIPICSKCNKTKSKYWIEDDERLFLNKYFDDDNLDEFLFCNPKIINKDNIIFEYCLDNEKLKENPIGNIIKTHYEKLNILTIYTDNSNSLLTGLNESLLIFKGNLQKLKESIEQHYQNCKEKYGINFYKTVTYKAIFETDEVLQWYFNRMPEDNKRFQL